MKVLKPWLTLLVIALGISLIPFLIQNRPQTSSPLTPSNLQITSVSSTGFVISWETGQPIAGALKLSPSVDFSHNSTVHTDKQAGTFHRFVILNLKPGTTYYLQILSDRWYDDHGNPIRVSLHSNN